jgi:hypothetical protein
VQRAPGIPHALKGAEDFLQSSGASRREIEKPCLMSTSAPHWPMSSPAKAATQYSRASVMEPESCGVLDSRVRGDDGQPR